jgi:TPR repeat protein
LIGKDDTKAAELYLQNCQERSHPSSCFNLAMLLLSKKITDLPENNKNKVTNTTTSSENNGKEISSDVLARDLLKKACELKDGLHGQACSAYASLCLSGTGGSRDIATAFKTLNKLCDPPYNDARACVRLGSVYLRGESTYPGVQKDTTKAFRFMKRACDELGHPNGCQVLAVMYSKGSDGVERNEALAEKYRELTKELVKKTGEKLGNVTVDPSKEG